MLHVALMWMFYVLGYVLKKMWEFPFYFKCSLLVSCDAPSDAVVAWIYIHGMPDSDS